MHSKEERNKEAQILKAIAHPIRLYIVETLLQGEKCVNEIRELFDVTQPNISQHLNILKFSGIVDCRQSGNLRCYYLKDSKKIKTLIQAVKGFVVD
jgi:DNA-binding transcriptional ArsR family regulator